MLNNLLRILKNKYDSSINTTYVVQGYERNNNGDYIVICKAEGARSTFPIKAMDLITNRKDLLARFNTDDIIHITTMATTTSPNNILIHKTPATSFYFPILAMVFGTLLIVSNIVTQKLWDIGGLTLTAGDIVYGLTYLLGDVIAEVYGYKRVRQLIWGTIAINVFTLIYFEFAIWLPSSIYWHDQSAFATVLGGSSRIIIASVIAYFFSEFFNIYVLAKLKLISKGKMVWVRIIVSSILAMTIDNFLFMLIAYWGEMPLTSMFQSSFVEYLISVLYELSFIPVVLFIAQFIKQKESIDIFDINTKFTPFSLDVQYSDINNRFKKEIPV